MIHPLADCMNRNIPDSTRIWQFCVIMPNCIIGQNCNICSNVFIENDVQIGNNVTVKCGVQLWNGVKLDDDVFVGPNVTFTNDLYPRSGNHDFSLKPTNVLKGASIGANSTIICGVTIGKHALIGAGSVVTKDVPNNTIWYGNPAKQKGYVTDNGIVLDINCCDQEGNKYNI